jgi:hypothetical protein
MTLVIVKMARKCYRGIVIICEGGIKSLNHATRLVQRRNV